VIYKYRVYVIELDDKDVVYVGQTCHSRRRRFAQHKRGYKSSRYVKRAKHPKLRPDLYRDTPGYKTRKEAEAAESSLAKKLEKLGYRVYGGH
jgi:hypothetical protein